MKSNDTPNPQRAMPSLPAETFLMGTDCERAFLRLVCGAMLALGGAVVANAVTVCDVRAYGAKADGTTMNTNAIQAAVDACAKKGGGKVRMDGGTFLSGPIVLESNIDLDIDSDWRQNRWIRCWLTRKPNHIGHFDECAYHRGEGNDDQQCDRHQASL
jgi:hypothetical protein